MPEPDVRRAPTNEVGAPGMTNVGGGLLPWSAYIDDREYAPDLRWPRSVDSYARMEPDAQLKGLLLATTLPIRRYSWELDRNGARPEVVESIARDYNLPIRGEEPVDQRRRKRFQHDRHLAHALRALVYGHFYFEQVFDYASPRDGGDGLLHLRKLGTRPPRTISNFLLDDDGGLAAIEQNVNIGTGGAGLAMAIGNAPKLEVDRLLGYVWDSADDGDWVGRSMLRSCFRNWLVKDRLIRVDATKHERNAMGIPWFETDASASQQQIDDLALIAERMRAGEQSGGAGPGKLAIKGVEGSLPDTVASVRYHDEQMSKAFLLLFFDLGKTETGSRALGSEFIDWYADGQAAIADWYRDIFQAHQIEDHVALNWGDDEQPPLLVYTRLESAELAISDLAQAVQSGLIAVEPELREYVLRRYQLPRPADPTPIEPAAPPTPPPPPAPTPPNPAARQRSAMATRLADALTRPMAWPDLAREVGTDPKNGTARRARDELLETGAILRRDDGILAPLASAALQLPSRDLHREPTEVEVRAQVNFATLDSAFVHGRATLTEALKAARSRQVEQLVNAVRGASGDRSQLAAISCDPVGTDVVLPYLQDAAREGATQARAEHLAQAPPQAASRPSAAQGDPDQGEIDQTLDDRAHALVLSLAATLSQAAGKRATAVASMSPDEAAAKVREYLAQLSDAYLEEQAGGAIWQSVNTGRHEYWKANPPDKVYASELLDERTCGPCEEIDGSEWGSVDAAESQGYPEGGYVDCEGGLRCRGTLVAVYGG